MGFMLKKEEYELLSNDLNELLVLSEAKTVMLCDRGGNVIVSCGDSIVDNVDIISALVAGSYAATKQLALALGEKEFTAIFHQGTKISIFISGVGDEVLLLSLFSDETNAGLVKMYTMTLCRKFSSLFKEIMSRKQIKIDDPTQTFKLSDGSIF